MLKVSIDRDMVGEMRLLAARFGETSDQATARLATACARELAVVTLPMGKGAEVRKAIQANIEHDARRVLVTRSAREFNALVKQKRPRRRTHRGWVAIPRGNFLLSEGEIWSWIEAHRRADGRVRVVSPDRKGVCRRSDFNKVVARRKKLAGITKGGWLGAGMAAARLQTGADKLSIGKNFMSWAQKHARGGSARWVSGKSAILLKNDSPAADNLLRRGWMQEALDRGWDHTRGWYRKAVRGLEKARLRGNRS